MLGVVFVLGVRLAAPLIVVMLVVELATGLVARWRGRPASLRPRAVFGETASEVVEEKSLSRGRTAGIS